MTNQKKRKNKFIKFFLTLFILNLNLELDAKENKCKTFDFKCKTSNFINETKKFQKKGLDDSSKQINDTKDEIIKIIPKKK